jgi:hypothetical protein
LGKKTAPAIAAITAAFDQNAFIMPGMLQLQVDFKAKAFFKNLG